MPGLSSSEQNFRDFNFAAAVKYDAVDNHSGVSLSTNLFFRDFSETPFKIYPLMFEFVAEFYIAKALRIASIIYKLTVIFKNKLKTLQTINNLDIFTHLTE